jgi:hypothetical protein
MNIWDKENKGKFSENINFSYFKKSYCKYILHMLYFRSGKGRTNKIRGGKIMKTNELFKEVVTIANNNKKDENITDYDIIALIYKYWEAECSEQELLEDFSYIVNMEIIPNLIEGIKNLNPDNLEGIVNKKYQAYFQTIQEENE